MTGETTPSPAPVPDVTAGPAPAAGAPSSSPGTTAGTVLAQAAPWSSGVSWAVVMTQGIVLVVIGLLLVFATGFAAHTVLQILGLVLLVRAVIVIYRLVRGQVPPGRLAVTSFEGGVNATTGLLVLFGTLFVPNSDASTTALAAVLGIGFLLFGAVDLLAAWVGREPGERLPLARTILGAAGVVIGILLAYNATQGIDAVRGAFVVLGWLLVLAGIGLAGYSLMLRSSNAQESDT